MLYCLVPLGCQMNQSDSERICSVLESMGYRRTDEEENADILGIVACSVRQKAIDRAYARIDKWNRWKNRRNLLTFISGCILPADREKFLTRFDLLFTINELPELPEMIRQYGIVTPASLRPAPDQPERPSATGAPTAVAADVAESQAAAPPSNTAQFQRVRIQLQPGPRRGNTRGTGAAAAGDGDAAVADAGGRNAGGRSARDTTAGSTNHGAAGTGEAVPGGRTNEAVRAQGSVGTLDLGSAFWKIAPTYTSHFEAYVPIQNGCDKFCTFCAVPYTRGREVSRASQEILAEVESLVSRGYKSVSLLGQNVNSYGLDRNGAELSFPQLLREIGEIGRESDRRFWVYFTSPHPRDMTEEVLRVIAEYPCLAKQLHLPIQSGDDKVLIRMNRNYRVDAYRRIVENIRGILPSATLFTDIIVGFTGETVDQFENTRRAMREFRYNMAYVAMYSPRPGAASARWDDDVPLEEKKRRLHELSEELQATSLAHNQRMLGSTVTVLVDGHDRKEGYLSGTTEDKLVVCFPSTDSRLIGTFVRMKIISCAPLSLEGELDSEIDPTTDDEIDRHVTQELDLDGKHSGETVGMNRAPVTQDGR